MYFLYRLFWVRRRLEAGMIILKFLLLDIDFWYTIVGIYVYQGVKLKLQSRIGTLEIGNGEFLVLVPFTKKDTSQTTCTQNSNDSKTSMQVPNQPYWWVLTSFLQRIIHVNYNLTVEGNGKYIFLRYCLFPSAYVM